MRCKFIFVFLLITTSVFGQSGLRLKFRNPLELYAEQRRVVGNWCRMDYEGLRLTPDGWNRFKPLTSQKDNPDSSTIVIVSRYQIAQHDPQAISWNLDVIYNVIGRYQHSTGFQPAGGGPETVTYRTKEVDGDLVITDVDPTYPHMSKRAAIDWIKKELASTTISDVEKYYLNSALKQLEPPAATTPTPQPAN
jgi:hypothetical protein